jgi:signal transduction histidine kinase
MPLAHPRAKRDSSSQKIPMAMLGQSSFRRILLLRILLLSIPILFLGTGVTFRKARESLLKTAKVNLEQSAVRKAASIKSNIDALSNGLAIASQTAALKTGSPISSKVFLTQLKPTLPGEVLCLQMKDLVESRTLASTCGNHIFNLASAKNWPKQETPANRLKTRTIEIDPSRKGTQTDMTSQLTLIVSTPIYDNNGQLRYSLSAQTILKQPEGGGDAMLEGYTAVMDENGVFIAHPYPDRVGERQDSRFPFQSILNNVKNDESGVQQLTGISDNETEWMVGYSPILLANSNRNTPNSLPSTSLDPNNDNHIWSVLAVTTTDSAVNGLEDIKQSLLILTAGLLAAHLLAMVYMARDLALPIEQLGKYALRIHRRNSSERAPRNFRIRELNHLAEVLDNMVGRLEERAKELESAWQEAEAANQIKSEFLANTSHELRTPLNAIIGCIRLVKDGCCDSHEEEVEFLEQADKAAIHLLKIINDLLDIQRIEEDKLPLAIETIDLRQILKDAVALETVQTNQKGLQLIVKAAAQPLIVRADPARLRQVLLNVLYNAAKFTDEGSITVETRLDSAPSIHGADAAEKAIGEPNGHNGAGKSWVILSVKDTGIGIDPTQQHKLFRPFVMVDGTTTRKFEGTGLGLAISRNLIELMGGRISLYSDGIGHGTTVRISLPIFEAPTPTLLTRKIEGGSETAKTAIETSVMGQAG